MAQTDLRRWLKKHPHPVSIRAYDSDDDEKMFKMGVSKSRFRDAEESLGSFSAVKLEALDADNNVLRVLEFEGEASSGKKGKGKDGVDVEAMLIRFAEIYDSGCDKAAQRHEAAYRLGFEHQATLIGVLSARLQALEKAWHTALMNQAPGEGGDINLPTIMALLGGAMGLPGAPNVSEKPPNGTKKP